MPGFVIVALIVVVGTACLCAAVLAVDVMLDRRRQRAVEQAEMEFVDRELRLPRKEL